MPMYCLRITIGYLNRIFSNKKNKCVTINNIDDTTLYHETVNVQLRPSSNLSDILKVLERNDIFILLKISTGYSKYFVHALHERMTSITKSCTNLCALMPSFLCNLVFLLLNQQVINALKIT